MCGRGSPGVCETGEKAAKGEARITFKGGSRSPLIIAIIKGPERGGNPDRQAVEQDIVVERKVNSSKDSIWSLVSQ